MGRNASARDWALGETIVVPFSEPTGDEIQVYPGLIYLAPAANGTWTLHDFGRLDPPEAYADLASATRGAHDYIARWERERGVPRR